jgi:hypothetical protein
MSPVTFKILTKMYATNSEIVTKPGDLTLLTPPFTLTAKEFIGESTGKQYPNEIQNYYFQMWTIETGVGRVRFQNNRTLKINPIVLSRPQKIPMEATAWYSPAACGHAIVDPNDPNWPPSPDPGTYAYAKTFLLKERVFVSTSPPTSPIETVDPISAVYQPDPNLPIVNTTGSIVNVKAKNSIQPGTAFDSWYVFQDPSIAPELRATIAGQVVTLQKGSWANLIANYKSV